MTHLNRPILGSVPRALALAGALLLLLTLAPARVASAQSPPATFDGDVEIETGGGGAPTRRFAGDDRIETSGLIATDDTTQAPFDPAAFSGDTVILARSELEFDALAGSVLGGLEDAPIVLTPPNTAGDNGMLNEDTLATLEEFDDLQEIFLLGSTAAIGEDIETELGEQFPDADITRVGGVNRFETAALISQRVAQSDDVIVARADDAADALVAGAIAAEENIPILLTGRSGPLDEFAAAELERLDPDRVIIAGGTMAIAQDTEDDIEATTEADILRVAGGNAFSTAVRFAQLAANEFGFGTDHINLARRDVAFDALALGPHAALDVGGPAPILLTGPTDLPNETEEYFTGEDVTMNEEDLGEGINDCLFESLDIAGGIAAVSENVEDEARTLLAGAPGEPCNIELTPESATNLVGESHTVTAFVTDNAGDPSETGTVRFEAMPSETGTANMSETATARPIPESATVPVSETGTATFTFTSATPGRVTITASVTDSEGNVETATATKLFIVPEGAFALNGGSGAPVAGQAIVPASLEGLFDEEDQTIDGVNEGTSLVAIDVRPSTGQLYGLGDDGELYKLDQDEEGTVTATSVGNVNDESGAEDDFNFDDGVGFDFNPIGVVALRITTSEGDSLRVNFDGMGNISEVIIDPSLFKTTGSGSETETAVATGAAYTNNPEPGSNETATATMLFAIDTDDDTLVRVNFMTGQTTFVADLSGDIDGDVSEVNGFDIVVSPSGDNVAYVLLTIDDEVGLFTVNLQTGEGFFVTEAESSDGLALGAFVNDQDMNTDGGGSN